jgi:mono/diheme cytochrome c family protein
MEYHKIVLVHRILVSLFLLHYVVKGILLLINQQTGLDKYSKITKVPEMILSVLFLASGVYLLIYGSNLNFLQYIKIACVLTSIPIAVIGFKKKKKFLAVLSIFLLIAAYGLAEVAKKKQRTQTVDTESIDIDTADQGKIVYNQLCSRCHGDNGDGMIAGAKNLKISTLSSDEISTIISKGQGGMPAFENLSESQLKAVVQYTESLKQQ